MKIRPATRADLPAILDIHNDAVRRLDALWLDTEDTLEDREKWFAAWQAANLPVLVAVDETDQVLGYASYGTYRPREGYRLTVEHSVYVFPHAQGKGAGRALLDAVIDDARQKGYHAIVAVIEAGNTHSIRMHEKFGFEGGGLLRQVGQKFGRWLDQVQMVLLLDDRPGPPKDR